MGTKLRLRVAIRQWTIAEKWARSLYYELHPTVVTWADIYHFPDLVLHTVFCRDAALMAFGSILEGPDPTQLKPLVEQAMPMLIELMKDNSVVVKVKYPASTPVLLIESSVLDSDPSFSLLISDLDPEFYIFTRFFSVYWIKILYFYILHFTFSSGL